MATTSGDDNETKNPIRKYRKKLRDIERLERLNRPLSPDEILKVRSKNKFRKKLQTLLADYVEETKTEEAHKETEKVKEVVDVKSQDIEQELPHQSSQESKGEECTSQKEEANVRKELISSPKTEEAPKQQAPKQHPKNKGSGERTVEKIPEVKAQSKVALSGDGSIVKEKKKSPPKPSLSSSQFKVRCLEGHSDQITAVVLHKDTIVTASQDTTVKTWDVVTGTQKKNFGGHTNSITCLVVLDVVDAQKSVPDLLQNDEPVVVSGSFDCSLKIWSLHSGQQLKSIYTYNPISKISYMAEFSLLVLGSDTGKLELWDLNEGEQKYSLHAYDASITGIRIDNRHLQTSASDGTIKIYSITDDAKLSCIFESENIQSSSGGSLTQRHIRSLELCEKGTLIGDDARNIKILYWKKNEASKIPNHHADYSSTDAIQCHGKFVIASSYDLDSGLGYLNVRCSRTLDYLATLDDKDTERILCVDFGSLPNSDNMVIVTGGTELKVWEVFKPQAKSSSGGILQAEYRRDLAEAAVDSEEDDDDDDEDDEYDSMNVSASGSTTPKLGFQQESDGGWMSWCSVI